jgi:hypothetical protein
VYKRRVCGKYMAAEWGCNADKHLGLRTMAEHATAPEQNLA